MNGKYAHLSFSLNFLISAPLCRCVGNWGLIFCGILLCTGCVSLVEKAGQALDGSAFEEKKIAVYRTGKKVDDEMEIREMKNKAGERSVIISLDKHPAMKIRGGALPAESPNQTEEFTLKSLDYLGGNTHGWNEYRLDLFGSGTVSLGATTASLSINGEIEPVEISFGKIKRYDTRITGTEALTSLRNRRERIIVLTEWMNSRDDTPAAGFSNIKTFENYWRPVLFPEMVAKKKRPEHWQQEDDRMVAAENINWNVGYTDREFPDVLREIRNSGTMLRDWEEALDWIFFEYEWEGIKERLAKETMLMRN